MNNVKAIRIRYDSASDRGSVVVLSIAGTFFWILAVAFVLSSLNVPPDSTYGIPLFFLPPLIAIWKLVNWSKRHVRETHLAAIKKAADAPFERHTYLDRDSSLTLTKDKLLVVQKRTLAVIPLTSIRKAWWEIPGYETVSVYGFAAVAGFQAGLANNIAKAEAAEQSGFFFEVADVRNPLWFFHCTDIAILRQWNEILRQAFEKANVTDKVA